MNLCVKKLILELSSANNVGLDLRVQLPDEFQKIKDARGEAREIERKNLLSPFFASQKEWRVVADLCVEALSRQTKDIEIVAILIEALLRLQGFTGLAAGFELAADLVEKYGYALYPLLDSKEPQEKFSCIAQLNGIEKEGILVSAISLIALTENTSHGTFSLWHYQQAMEFSQKNSPVVDEYPNLAKIISAAKETSADFFLATIRSIELSIQSIVRLDQALEKLCGEISPSTYRIKSQLDLCLACVSFLSQYAKQHPSMSGVKITSKIKPIKSVEKIKTTGVINSRAEALTAVEESARFFREAEPHSPLPYLLEKALAWGQMDFPNLLNELVHDEIIKKQIYQLTGVKEKTNE